MRILYLTQWFVPEPNIIKGVAFVQALERAGHEVTVVTGFPNYPAGKLYPGYRLRPIRRETIDGVRVVRLPLYPSHDASSLRRSLNYLSFFLSALVYSLWRAGRYDLAYVYHPPITVGLAAAIAGRLRGLPFVIEIQDLWPDTIVASGMSGTRRIAGPIGLLCRFVYRRAIAIVAQSQGMRQALIERGVPPAKLTTIRNWAVAEPGESDAAAADAASGNKRFTVVYGGNFGPAQALDTVIDAALIVARENANVEIVLQGEGIEAKALRERAARLGTTALRFAPRVPQREILSAFAKADVLLLHATDHPLFEITIPSKTQFYLALGRPIVAGIAGEAAEMLAESGAAIVVPPCDPEALAQAILDLSARSAGERAAMGEKGLRYYRDRLSLDAGMAATIDVLARAEAAMSKKGGTG